MTASWKWKNKNGEQGGLLYESGNWGDILKMLWLSTLIRWKENNGGAVRYVDPFAGDVQYPLGEKLRFRLSRRPLPQLIFLQKPFFDKKLWPSAASAALLLATGGAEVWDADETRRNAWQAAAAASGNAVRVPQNAASGWDIVSRMRGSREGVPDSLLLVDPYDFLSEWRERLPLLLETSGGEDGVATLIYVYNRSGKSKETFQNYRRFRSRLDEATRNRPKRVARIAADAFLPDAHHELVLLPGERDAARPDFGALLDELAACAYMLNDAQRQTSVCDC